MASKLTTTTVTVRILPARGENGIATARGENSALPARGGNTAANRAAAPVTNGAGNNGNNDASNQEPSDAVTICSGVSVEKGLLVTCGLPLARQLPETARFRVTLPGGEQTKATLRVVDHYSTLSLLELDEQDLPVLELAQGVVNVGSAVLTAAASGIERPVVSLGIVGGVDRTIGGNEFPPLLQCDVRTTETSSGAAIVDRQGKLLGIIVATSLPTQQAGWTYAVPVRHVRRLIQARVEGKLVVLARQRPSVGCTLGAGTKEGTVEIERVVPGGPADKAGIKRGDLVLEADGRKIRSAYQAVDLLLSRQPGETFNFIVEQDNQRKSVDVTLGGVEVQPKADNGEQQIQQNAYAQPQVQVRVNERNKIEVRNGAGVAELDAFQLPRRDVQQRSAGDEVSLLKAQLTAFDRVIAQLKEELVRREKLETKNSTELQELREEVQQLRRQVGGKAKK